MIPSRRATASLLAIAVFAAQTSLTALTPAAPSAGLTAPDHATQDTTPKVMVCVPRDLVERLSWDHPEAGSRVSDFKEAVALYVEGIADSRRQYRVLPGAFEAFTPQGPNLQAWIQEVDAGQACPADTVGYTLPARAEAAVRTATSGAGERCNALASVPGDPLAVGAGVLDGQIDIASALPACEAATSSRPFNPRYAFLYGRVLEEAQRYQEAARYHQMAADAGVALAADALARLYYSGLGVAKSDAGTARYARQAAEGGVAAGMFKLAFAYEFGIGVPADDEQAMQWFRKAGDAGFMDGYALLGRFYMRGERTDHALAGRWFQYSADRGSDIGAENLGYLYELGRGVAQDQAMAVAWFRKAADSGNVRAMRQLGMHLRQGAGVAWNEAQAMQWFQKAAERGDTTAQSQLAYGYTWGLGKDAGQGRQDYKQAAYWYTMAARAGDPVAELDLGVLYANGWGVAQDFAQARSLFQRAATSGLPDVVAAARRYQATLDQKTASNGDWVGGAIVLGLGALLVYSLASSPSSSDSDDTAYPGVYTDPFVDYRIGMNQIAHCAAAGGTPSVFDSSICY